MRSDDRIGELVDAALQGRIRGHVLRDDGLRYLGSKGYSVAGATVMLHVGLYKYGKTTANAFMWRVMPWGTDNAECFVNVR